ncbi:hypothetical protein CKO15_00920 [Halorhodospira abdelmalekii]|uniref:fused MFS/spermidine synthase n=1 Tax=Halorhodospira abdelmalekii TaxID=421629 RepID=UPI00190626FC|nr:fused MFS/spermidine synthase [Halorhodospira abdelmalekii]MBK1733862.1 hypothetical protein [Halorhodospira abdelmalekii]
MNPERIRITAVALFFLSGFAALVYQVVWVRELGLLFGNTAQAAALTIAVFFSGLALGGWFWGRLAPRLRSALAAFGGVEIAVAVTAGGGLFLGEPYHTLYPLLSDGVAALPGGELLLRVGLATLLLFPPAFLMGGTLPLMGQALVVGGQRLATMGTALYAINTFGSVTGALAAGFFLPIWLGYSGTYGLAIAIDLTVGLAALLIARRLHGGVLAPSLKDETVERPTAAAEPAARRHSSSHGSNHGSRSSQKRQRDRARRGAPGEDAAAALPLPWHLIWMIAAGSGIATLGVEVLWTRLFAQVLQNSVYTYAIVLVAFLLALACGSLLANLLVRLRRPAPQHILLLLLLSAALVVALSPWAFHTATGGFAYVGSGTGWYDYLAAVSALAVGVMVLPGVLLGAVLPYLLRLVEAANPQPGEVLGRLVAANTGGAIGGALLAGFVLLPLFGATISLLLLAVTYPLLAVLVLASEPVRTTRHFGYASAALLAAATLLLGALRPEALQIARVDEAAGERLLEVREGTHATVALVARDQHRLLRVNNYYTLGGSGGLDAERNQTLIPLMAHPEPRRIFYLGLGTGITAGTALRFPSVEQVEVCELLPEVVDFAERHFGEWNEGLFDDPRVTVRAHDGHHCLRHSDQAYDVIISDLFTPWKAGTGNLYTREHYEVGRQRLAPGGLFVQWLPLYQLTDREFGSIARTMDEVFEQVVAWRGDLFATGSIVALIGTTADTVLDPQSLIRHGRILAGNPSLPEELLLAASLRMYVGQISGSDLFDDYPINTLNRPVIEFQAPHTQRRVQAGELGWLVGPALGHFYEALAEAVPTAHDPYLRAIPPAAHDYIRAGRHFYHYSVLHHFGHEALAQRHLETFLALTPFEAPPPPPQEPATRAGWEE